ncbi:MAG TPA: response regulator [Burkholderiaceae bacterium]
MESIKKILVADDDARNRKLLETLLTSDGYRVASVGSGQAALSAAMADKPDLILLDLMMPGMDGFEVLRRLKAMPDLQEIDVVMVTALDDSGSRARMDAAGAAGLLLKPVDRWKLKEMTQQLLGGGNASG